MTQLLAVLAIARWRQAGIGRAVLSACGIALGVALGYGVHLVNDAALAGLTASVHEISGGADLEVRGGPAGFAEALYPTLARLPGVASAAPRIDMRAALVSGGTVRVLGIDVLREPALIADPALRSELLKSDTAVVSEAVAASLGGRALRLVVGGRELELRVAGSVPMRGEIALLDISTAQWRLGRLGQLDRLELRLVRGADAAAVQSRAAALLPPGSAVSTLEEEDEASAYPSRAYRVNMTVLALVALFTGGFLVFSAQALESARRRGEHALLRVLGLTARELTTLVLAEAAVLGAAGAAVGLAAGYGLAELAVRLSGGDLGSGAFRGVAAEVRLAPGPALVYFGAGIAVALAGALVPARDAAHSPPARALKPGDEQAMLARASSAWPPTLLIIAGALLATLAPVRGLPLFGYASIACLLLGSVAWMPRLSTFVFARVPLPRAAPGTLALAQLRGAPGQAAVSLAAIVASFSLMAAMAIMVSSFRVSVDDWLSAVLPADLYFRTAASGDTAYLEPALAETIRTLPQAARVDFLRVNRVQLDPRRPPVAVIARDRAARAFPPVGRAYAVRPGDPPPMWISEAVLDVYGWRPGQAVRVPLAGAEREFVVAGVFRDYARQHGALLVERADYVALTGDRRVNDGAIWLASGASAVEAMQALRSLTGTRELEISVPAAIREQSLRVFDRSFAVTYAMEALAVVVGLFGLSSSIGAIVLARRREFGVLRHLGVTRSQIGSMLACEGGLLSLLGTLAGLLCGTAISLVLVYVVNRQSFNWGMSLHPPYALLAALGGIVVVLGIATAFFSGREATSQAAIRSVKDDW